MGCYSRVPYFRKLPIYALYRASVFHAASCRATRQGPRTFEASGLEGSWTVRNPESLESVRKLPNMKIPEAPNSYRTSYLNHETEDLAAILRVADCVLSAKEVGTVEVRAFRLQVLERA